MGPLVSVKVATYNQEKYIAQCLEGILMQRTTFPFEILVGEDWSTDNTAGIVAEYQKAWPAKIRVLQYGRNVGPNENILRLTQASTGKYHAICEGDDYWIDPLKLQKQVDFLEAHEDYSMCFHDAIVIFEGRPVAPAFFCPADLAKTVGVAEMIRIRGRIPTASVVLRASLPASLPKWRNEVLFSDLVMKLWCTHQGKVQYMREPMSVYRNHAGGLSNSARAGTALLYFNTREVLRRFDAETGHCYAPLIRAALRRTYLRTRIASLLGPLYPAACRIKAALTFWK